MSTVNIKSEFNRQMNQELRNAYLYLSMAAYFDSLSLNGFANYFKVQAREELEHAMKLYQFIIDRGWEVELEDIPKPKTRWSSILEAVEDFLKAEQENTQSIWRMVDHARQAGDKAAENLLQWFVSEQVEEEKIASELLAKVKLIKDNPAGIIALDRVLAERK
ncbi:ferritin [Infirmifilum uzonense]|uniref:Ferritin n=1 Tax=Infirmifilum uzonense TaxID=1550241 RepID=A0A0F7CL06_9CREN|nr:ferritin [Infirmifilum uzonense]AKG38576.1 ferritin [Infirmifilum uzonense]